ncbi:unnamed protein product [Mucor hiemalis]
MTSILSLFYQVWACILSDNGAMDTMRTNLAYTPIDSYFAREIKSTFQQERLSQHYKIIKDLLILAWYTWYSNNLLEVNRYIYWFLIDYIRNKKNPDFNEFVNSSLENIIAVSYKFQGKYPDLLFAWWRRVICTRIEQEKQGPSPPPKIEHNEQKWVEVKNVITALAQTRSRYQSKGLKALADSATSSRRILTLNNALTDESSNASIDDVTSSSPTDDTNNPLVDDTSQHADDTIDDNDGFLFPGADASLVLIIVTSNCTD